MVVPLQVAEEVEGVQSTYGLESVLLHKELDARHPGATRLEIEVRPRGEEANTLVWVTLLVTLPVGYPLEAVPRVEVWRSRGINDTQVRAALEAADAAIERDGRQDCGCLVSIVIEVASALASSLSECAICQEICKASEAIDAPCGDVFHESCLRDWADLKKVKRVAEADKATEPVVAQLEAIRRDIVQAEEHEESTQRELQQQQLRVQEAEQWLAKAQRKARVAMGEEVGDSEEEDEEDSGEEVGEEEEESSDDNDGRDGRHQKIKFNNTGWGSGKKKNHQPSSTRNKKRPKKYLNQVENIVEERREKAKAELIQKADPQILAWQRANQDLKEAKALLDRVRTDLYKDEKKTEDLKADLEELEQARQAQRNSIIKVTIPCPVCQNPLDPDGVIQQQRANEVTQQTTLAEATRKRRAAEAATGRLDILLEAQGNGYSEGSVALPKETQRLLGVYIRDPEPVEGFPEGRPTYVGPKGCKLHFRALPDGSGHWVVSLGRLDKLILEDSARTPDYADEESVWQVATSEGFCDARELRAVCVNSEALLGPQQPPPPAAVAEEARVEVREVQQKVLVVEQRRNVPPEPRARHAAEAAPTRRPSRTKKPSKARRKQTLEELAELVSDLVASFDGDEESLLDSVDEILGSVKDAEMREALMVAVEESLAEAPPRSGAKGRRAAG